MTSQSPRIYTYKITFEEVPYYYYGSKKEKYYNQKYFGSPKANKWCWELYTPKKQILEFFDYTDEGYEECRKVEDRLIKPVYQIDKWCLNESCGGIISLKINREAGRKSGLKSKENKTGVHGRSKEKMSEDGKKSGKISYILGVGVHGRTKKQKIKDGRKGGLKGGKQGGQRTKELGNGIFSIPMEEHLENCKKGGKIGGKLGSKIINSQKWMCLETGYITTSGGLSRYQKARGIDTSKRVRIS